MPRPIPPGLRRQALLSSVALVSVATAAPALATDRYDPVSWQLTIPAVGVGAATYTDVVVSVPLRNLVSGPSGTSPNAAQDSYNPANHQLTVPALAIGSSLYYNLVVTPAAVISVGGVTGADTYDGHNLHIPSVQLRGGAVYENVVASVDHIVNAGGGAPAYVRDVYDPASHELTIAAIELNGRVYVNAVVAIAGVVSVGGRIAGETVLHDFGAGGTDASQPSAGLVAGTDGNFYGVSATGGAYGLGTFFRITPAGTVSVLYSFGAGPADGAGPDSLVAGADGFFYGTTGNGGANGWGSVFRVASTGAETVLHSFTGATAGGVAFPNSLVVGSDGKLYGTSLSGGAHDSGTIFAVTPAGQETILHSFGSSAEDGLNPCCTLIQASDGRLVGTAAGGPNGNGIAFAVTTGGVATTLAAFPGAPGASTPTALLEGPDHDFYGAAQYGGTNTCNGGGVVPDGCGAVFRLTPAGQLSVLYSFGASPTDGIMPASLVVASDGNLYGTTLLGGTNGHAQGRYGSGTFFRLTPGGDETLLYSFGASTTDALGPPYPVLPGADGSFYGVTPFGGVNTCANTYPPACGVAFRITP